MGNIFLVLFSYLLGSVPTGYIFGKVLKNVDIREHGSGNVGATNVFRAIGKIPGIIVLVIDFLKGFLAIAVLPILLGKVFPGLKESGANTLVFAGMAVIAGHIWTIFLQFKGGKGVATTAGVLAGLAPVLLFSCLCVFVLVFSIWRVVSLASVCAAVMLPIFAVIFNEELFFILFCSVLCLVAVFAHRQNIKRLIRGEEKRLM